MFKHIVPKSEFARNVMTLMGGTSLAQLIVILMTPVLTRIYAPDAFGTVALFAGISGIVAVLATAKYDLAVMIPKEDHDAVNIVAASVVITVCVSLAFLALILLFHEPIVRLFDNAGIGAWLYLLPLAVLLNAVFQVFHYWNNRHTRYKNVAVAQVTESISNSILKLLFGFGKAGAGGLIVGNLLGRTIAAGILIRDFLKKDRELFGCISREKMKEQLYCYRNYPRFVLWTTLLNTASLSLPVLIFSVFFPAAAVGMYALAHRLLRLPLHVLGHSIGQVFFQKAASFRDDREKLAGLAFKVYKKLLLVASVTLLFVTVYGDLLFAFVLGDAWREAGEYAQVMSIWMLMVFVTSPLAGVLLVLEKQREELVFNIALFLVRGAVLLAGGVSGLDIYTIIVFYVAVSALFFIGFNLYIMVLLKIGIVRYLLMTLLTVGTVFSAYLALRSVIGI